MTDLDALERLWLRCVELVDEPGTGGTGHSAAYYRAQSRAMSAAFEALPDLIKRLREAEVLADDWRHAFHLTRRELGQAVARATQLRQALRDIANWGYGIDAPAAAQRSWELAHAVLAAVEQE